MATKVSSLRGLLVLLLGELLYVERRLAGGVLGGLANSVTDAELAALLRHHLEETEAHVDRVETVFRRIDVAPSAHRVAAFESALDSHDRLAGSFVGSDLGDLFHAQGALHTEHWEIAATLTVLQLGEAGGHGERLAELRDSLAEEREAARTLGQVIERLSVSAKKG